MAKATRTKKVIKPADLNKVERWESKYKNPPLDFYVPPVSTWNATAVASALSSHERGQFNLSGKLSDALGRDERVDSVLNTRVLGVLGLPFRWIWPDGYTLTKEDEAALEATKSVWPTFVNNSILATILRNVVMMGFNVCNVHWDKTDNMWLPKISPFHPSNIQFNTAEWRYLAYTQSDGTLVVNPEGPNWMVFSELDCRQPWMQGKVRSVGLPWIQKNFALGDWRALSAAHGMPIRKLKMPVESGTPPEQDPQQFIQDIATSARVGAPVLLSNGSDLELMEIKNNSSELFKDAIDQANTAIAIAILGQNLAVEVKGASLAATRAHLQILQEYLEADCAMLSQTFFNQLLQSFYTINFGPEVVVPQPIWDAKPPEDLEYQNKALREHALAIKDISTALEGLKNLAPQADLNKLLEMFKIPLINQ